MFYVPLRWLGLARTGSLSMDGRALQSQVRAQDLFLGAALQLLALPCAQHQMPRGAPRLMYEESLGAPRPGPLPGMKPDEWIAPTDWHGILFMGLYKIRLPEWC